MSNMKVLLIAALLPLSAAAQSPGFSDTSPTGGPASTVRIQLFPGAALGNDPYTSPDALVLGGINPGYGSSLIIRGQPTGCYDSGTLLSIVNTGLIVQSSRAGINGGCEQGVASIAGYVNLDEVNEFNEVLSTTPPLIVSGATYDAAHVYPPTGTTFSAAQLATLRQHEYVITNSINTSVSTVPPVTHGRPPPNYYASYVLSWSPQSIVVSGWAVPGAGNTASGQVPPAVSSPVTTFGESTTKNARNTFIFNNPAVAGSLTHVWGAEETDLINLSTHDYTDQFNGLTIGYDPQTSTDGGSAHATQPTGDSYNMWLYGGNAMPQVLKLSNPQVPGGYLISGDTFNVGSAASPRNWTGSPAYNLLDDEIGYIDSNKLLKTTFVERESGVGGEASASLNICLRTDGTLGNTVNGPQGALDGTLQGCLKFSPQGYQGGIALCVYQSVCGLYEGVGGPITMPSGLTVSGGALTVAGPGLFGQALTAPTIQTGHGYTVAGLNTAIPCGTATVGTRTFVVDATAPAFLATLVGGGSVNAPAYCNGGSWVAG